MKNCKQCGHPMKDGASFCPECGSPVSAALTGNTNTHQTQKGRKRLTKQQKIMTAAVAIVAILLFAFYQIGANLTSKEKAIDNLQQAIAEKDEKALAKLIMSDDPRLEITEKNLAGLISYMDKNPKYLTDLTKELTKQAEKMDAQPENSVKASGTSDALLTLKKTGKSLLVFDHYQFEIQPFYINVSTNYKDAVITLNGKEIATADSDEFQKEFGPYVPGIYKVKATYKDEYADLEHTETINSFEYGSYADVPLYLEALYVEFESNFEDAKIFVNGKDTKKTISELDAFGPVNPGVTIHLERSFPWGTVKTDEFKVSSDDTYAELYFEGANDDVKTNIAETIKTFQKSQSDGIIALDASKLSNVTIGYNEQKFADITSWKNSGLQYYGSGIKKIVVDLNSIEINYDTEEKLYSASAKYVATFNGDWSYADSTPEAIAEMKQNEEILYTTVSLVYDEAANIWSVDDQDEGTWSFEVEEGKEFTY